MSTMNLIYVFKAPNTFIDYNAYIAFITFNSLSIYFILYIL
jgi:hypothetical protein